MRTLNSCRINVMVSDMDRSIVFYQDTLDLALINRYGDHYAEIQAPDLLIGLHPKSEHTSYGNNVSIGLGVEDFINAVKELESKGVAFTMEDDGYVRLAHFNDPDGTHLFLAERRE